MSNQSSTYNIESFPGAKSHRLAWPTARRNYISRAMIAHNNGTDNTGLLYYLVETQEFDHLAFQLYPVFDEIGCDEIICDSEGPKSKSKDFVTFTPQKRPNWDSYFSTDADGNQGPHDTATYNHFFNTWDRQELALQKFTAKFLESLDEVALGAIGPPTNAWSCPYETCSTLWTSVSDA